MLKRCRVMVVFLYLLGLPFASFAKVVEYKLDINAKEVDFSGKKAIGLTVNQTIPGPTLKASIGDILRVKVTNHLAFDTSIHWHGVLVPNNMDGVPFVNTPPIKQGTTFTYEFPIKQSGTYWYHAHSALQEQQGVYGSMVFYPKPMSKDHSGEVQYGAKIYNEEHYDEEHVLVLSDWTDENPKQVLANLKKDSDYYALKKDSVQSWLKVLKNGTKAIQLRLSSSWSRMGPMDMSDIGYDAFLINGQKSSLLSHAKPGTRVKLRIINAASSSYFIFQYSGGNMKVIESDGNRISPVTASKVKISMAETYDVIITVPDNNTYEFRASSEDGTGFATAHIGQGDLIPAPLYPKPNLMLMSMHGMKEMDHSSMTHASMAGMTNADNLENSVIKNSNNHLKHKLAHNSPNVFFNDYKNIQSVSDTTLPINNVVKQVKLRLTGSMQRYVWNIDNVPMYAADKIIIKKGENVRFSLVNETMMNHPIHLHGHFFRVLNGQGNYSPLKHTVNVSAFETVNIEFEANNEKDWIFHCHNLYHMNLGMGGMIHYDQTDKDKKNLKHHSSSEHSSDHGDVWFNFEKIEGYSNFSNVSAKIMRNNDYFFFDARHNYKKTYEAEAFFERYVSQFLGIYAGGKLKKEKEKRLNTGILGISYTLPLLLQADLRFNSKGKMRVGFSNEHQLMDRLAIDWKWNTDKEYTFSLRYEMSKVFYGAVNYDSKEQYGVGLILSF